MSKDIKIEFNDAHPQSFVTITEKETGVTETKSCSIEQVATLLRSYGDMNTGILPGADGIRYMKIKDGSPKGIYQMSAREIELNCNHGKKETIKTFIPSVVLTQSKNFFTLYCATGRITSETDPLYVWPFGNVGSTGVQCWGENAPPVKIVTLKTLEIVASTFLSGWFNGHIFGEGCARRDEIRTVNDLAKYVAKKGCFPNDLLVKTSKTFASLIQELS